MNPTHPRPLRLLPLVAAVLLVGCANPYLAGYTGDTRAPLHEDAPVRVIGANREDVLAMRVFDFAYSDAIAQQTLLGSSTIISTQGLRDGVAAKAARELGADTVLYTFAYVTSTVETDTTTRYSHFHDDGNNRHYRDIERTRSDTTRHWFEYRAYFFVTDAGPPTGGPLDPPR
jgi:hypothetical protein